MIALIASQGWTTPFMMAPINTRVVRRSSMLYSLIGKPYGPHFKYTEVVRKASQS